MSRNWILPLLIMFALSGCFGGDGDNGPDDPGLDEEDGGSGDGNETNDDPFAPPGNGTDDGTGNGTGEPLWQYEEISGTVSGNDLIVQQPSQDETFNVQDTATQLSLEFAVDGNELEIALSAPSCEEASCAQTSTTSGGAATMDLSSPEAGSWTLTLTPQGGPGPVSSDYNIRVGQLIAEEGPAMNETEDGGGP